MDVAIPFSQDARNSVEERVAVAKDFADKVVSFRVSEASHSREYRRLRLLPNKISNLTINN
jgi:hypothetical protein